MLRSNCQATHGGIVICERQSTCTVICEDHFRYSHVHKSFEILCRVYLVEGHELLVNFFVAFQFLNFVAVEDFNYITANVKLLLDVSRVEEVEKHGNEEQDIEHCG